MIEVIQSDFARLESETSTAEAEGKKEYDEFMSDSSADKEAKSKDIESKSGCTSTPRVGMYFFSNSPVRCLFTNVVLPTPPSPTNTSLNSGACMVAYLPREANRSAN